ncbi:MAG: GNAT family N-acetyltransferase [Promethearchaeota archaeon]
MLKSKNLSLREIRKSDLSKFVKWLNEPDITEFLTIIPPLTCEQEQKWYEEMYSDDARINFSIDLNETGELIGTCGFNINRIYKYAHLGIILGEKKYWNKGYGTKCLKLLINHIFSNYEFERIELDVFEYNLRAIRCYEKVGFVKEGIKRNAIFKKGKYQNIVMMSILRSEWKKE